MKSSLLVRRIILSSALAMLAIYSALITYAVPKNYLQASPLLISQTATEKNVSPAGQVNQTAGLPVRLSIPRINVDAAIQYVGLTKNGAMDMIKSPDDVAWFNLGQRPGNSGAAVIAGHFGRWKNGKGSVFDHLSKLRQGDILTIQDDRSITTTFVVRESKEYDPKADASEVFNASDGKAHLNLITCEGVWNEKSKSYSKRLVVFAEKQEQRPGAEGEN